MVRIVFCLFADDTGIIEPRDIFVEFVEVRTGEDGADLGPWLAQLFEVTDGPMADRTTTLDEDLTQLPYVNGNPFAGTLRIPSFNGVMRQAVLDACEFDWSKISPAIFSARFPVRHGSSGAAPPGRAPHDRDRAIPSDDECSFRQLLDQSSLVPKFFQDGFNWSAFLHFHFCYCITTV